MPVCWLAHTGTIIWEPPTTIIYVLISVPPKALQIDSIQPIRTTVQRAVVVGCSVSEGRATATTYYDTTIKSLIGRHNPGGPILTVVIIRL